MLTCTHLSRHQQEHLFLGAVGQKSLMKSVKNLYALEVLKQVLQYLQMSICRLN